MIKKLLSIVFLFVFTFSSVKADEGMWLPQLLQQLNIEDMQAAGLKLSAKDLYDINNSSLKKQKHLLMRNY
jgi:hypothetical protein